MPVQLPPAVSADFSAATLAPASAGGSTPSAPVVAAVAPAIPPANAAPVQKKQPTAAELNQAVAEMQRKAQTVAPSLQFAIDHDSDRAIVKITDTNTGDVILQIPSEEVLRLNKEIDKMRGLFLDKKA